MADNEAPKSPAEKLIETETEAQRRERVAAQERKRHASVTMDNLYDR